jgi:hypothetical protein
VGNVGRTHRRRPSSLGIARNELDYKLNHDCT